MSEATQITEAREDAGISILPASLTALASSLGVGPGQATLTATFTSARGALTPTLFSDATGELSALISGVGVFDQGARARLRVTGEDRVRWLNGMVTNTVKALPNGAHNYTFVLNAQGRIQGDATVLALGGQLILETDRAQAERLYAHLDRFIIMDDVELVWQAGETTLGLAGPDAAGILASLGLPMPTPGSFALLEQPLSHGVTAHGVTAVVAERSEASPRFSLWVSEAQVGMLWKALLAAGATPAGAQAVEALRVLEATPLYGVDIGEKTLAQETGQMRALNFNKGCYLGQEIVERVRSRANVHRGLRQFALHGEPAAPGAAMLADGAPVGELTSIAAVTLPGYSGQLALGMVRTEPLDRGATLTYAGGTAEVAVLSATHPGKPVNS